MLCLMFFQTDRVTINLRKTKCKKICGNNLNVLIIAFLDTDSKLSTIITESGWDGKNVLLGSSVPEFKSQYPRYNVYIYIKKIKSSRYTHLIQKILLRMQVLVVLACLVACQTLSLPHSKLSEIVLISDINRIHNT